MEQRVVVEVVFGEDGFLTEVEGSERIEYGYKAYWIGYGVECEVYAANSYAAQVEAVEVFQRGTRKRVKRGDVTVVLCERADGSSVEHVAAF